MAEHSINPLYLELGKFNKEEFVEGLICALVCKGFTAFRLTGPETGHAAHSVCEYLDALIEKADSTKTSIPDWLMYLVRVNNMFHTPLAMPVELKQALFRKQLTLTRHYIRSDLDSGLRFTIPAITARHKLGKLPVARRELCREIADVFIAGTQQRPAPAIQTQPSQSPAP